MRTNELSASLASMTRLPTGIQMGAVTQATPHRRPFLRIFFTSFFDLVVVVQLIDGQSVGSIKEHS